MNKKRMNFKKSEYSLAFLAGVSTLFLVMLVGLSYAFLSQVLKGEKENTVTAGTLAIEYKDKKTINLDNIYPMSDDRGMMTDSYEFSVENTGDVKAIYDISLEEDQSTMNHSYLKYALKRNEEEWSEPKVLDSLKLREQIELEVGSKDNYELKLWMDENIGNEGQNKIFKARVVISSVQSNATAKDVTPPVIKLKGSLSENIEQNSEYTDPGVESVVDDKDTLDKNNITLSYEYYDGENTTEVENIDTSKLGVYYITYQITDKNGNIGKVIRSVNIYKKNTTPPVIRLNGKNLMAIKTGEEYTELGASATSGEKDLTSRIVTVGKVNNKKVGSYEIKYLITDNDGNTASIVRVVNVIHITSNIKADITLDLTDKPTDKIKLEGENLGDITYTSGDPDIVTVDENGNVTGKNPGTTTITIKTSTGHEETITVTITKTIHITYNKSTGIKNIGKTSDTCKITEKGGSCRITLPSVEGEKGYQVSGWYEAEEKVGDAGSTVEVTSDKTYIAKAIANTYTIVYHANGGSGNMANTTATTGKSISISANSFTKEGYTFTGWTTNSNGEDDNNNWTNFSGTWNYDNGEKGIQNNTLNLYAGWNINSYDVTYDYATNGGSSASKTSAKVNYNSAIDLTPSASKSGWTFVGWNTNKDATTALTSLTMKTSKVTLYAIFRKEAIKYTVKFNANGNTISSTQETCTIPAVYNKATQATTCSITSPTITAPTNTPSIIGYSTSASDHSNTWPQNTAKDVSGNGEYFAQTTKEAVERKITYEKGSGVSAIGKTSDSCTIGATYNSIQQSDSCSVTLPTITSLTGYDAGFWSTSSTATSGIASGTSISLSGNSTYYAKALDTTKPVWTIINISPSSNTVTPYETITITFEGTDTSNSVTSKLTIDDITVKTETTTQDLSNKKLEVISSTTNSKTYRLTFSGIMQDGLVSMTIKASTLTDQSGNQNLETTLTTGINIIVPYVHRKVFDQTNLGTKAAINTTDEEQTFITGTDPNNYIWYSGKLWRAIAKDTSDNSVKLVTENTIAAIPYHYAGNTSFSGSHMEAWLNDRTIDGFLENLKEPENFIKMDSKWNATLTTGRNKPPKTTIVTAPVGLLNIYEYIMSYNGTNCKEGYLNNGLSWWSITPWSSADENYVSEGGEEGHSSAHGARGIRPVVNLKPDIKIINGKGTKEDPYRLDGDFHPPENGTYVNTRYSGEYVRYGTGTASLYRIVSHENGGIKIVSDEPLKNNTTNDFLSSGYHFTEKFNPNGQPGTIGNYLNYTFISIQNGYLSTDQWIEDAPWYLGSVGAGGSYKTAKYTDPTANTLKSTTTAKIGLLRLGELMSGQYSKNLNSNTNKTYWTLTAYDTSNVWEIHDIGNSGRKAIENLSENKSGIRPVFNLAKYVAIEDGDGTQSNPFTLKIRH